MSTFSVKNFERFQHYKDRSPPWIKLYNDLLDNYEFGSLPDASKMHLIAIWLLASRSNNELPYDPEWVARRINATEAVDLTALASAGFILVTQPLRLPEQDASNVLALARSRETEGEERQRREETEPPEGGTPPKQKNPSAYAFEQGVVRLTAADIAKWEAAFPSISVRGELLAMEPWLAKQSNWFHAAAGALAKQQRKSSQGPPSDEGHWEINPLGERVRMGAKGQ
jgi:hypothetical protein